MIKTKLINLIIIVMCAIQSYGCSHTDNIVSVAASEFEKELKADSVILLDVRTPQEYAEGHIDGAINRDVKSDDFQLQAEKELSKDTTVLVYCRSGRRSMEAAESLAKLGYRVVNLTGGIIEWMDDGLPVSVEDGSK